MDIYLRLAEPSDIQFLREMLYEAVFWRISNSKPSLEEGLAYPGVKNALEDWGERYGDVAVIALVDSFPVGAAWYRYWDDNNNTRGYFEKETPVLAIGVQQDYRHKGIGKKMLAWLIDHALNHNTQRISLCVSKDNYAISLYKQLGFHEYEDNGNSLIMVLSLID